MKNELNGLIVPSITPFNADYSVNLDRIETLAAFFKDNGIKGAFICGTSGESLSLTTEERMAITTRWVEVAPEDFSVLVHVGHNSLVAAQALAAQAQKAGAWGIGAHSPTFFKPNNADALVDYCAQIAASAPNLPFYYYHIPGATGVSINIIDFLRAARGRLPNLCGIKFTSPNMMEYQLCREFDDGKYDVLFGIDTFLLCSLVLGGKGSIGGGYNFAGPLYNEIIDNFNRGDLDTARKKQLDAMKMYQVMGHSCSSGHTAMKAIMKLLDVDCGPARPPLQPITSEQYSKLEKDLTEIGFFNFAAKKVDPEVAPIG
jgi:N-acetylneuraminate lyase